MKAMRIVSPDTTWRNGTAPICSAWSLATLMMKSSPFDITSAIRVCGSGMKRISTLAIFA